MTTRHLIAYLLIVLLLGGVGTLIWRSIYYSEHRVRRRERHARRNRELETEETPPSPPDSTPPQP